LTSVYIRDTENRKTAISAVRLGDESTAPACHLETMPTTAIPSRHSRSLLAQFGLTPKSRRGLAAGDVVDELS